MPDNQNTKRLKAWHALLAFFILLILTWTVHYMRAKANFEAAKDKIRAEGYPATYSELNEWYSVPDGEQNAADAMQEAFNYFVEWEAEKRELLPVLGLKNFAVGEPYEPNTLQLAEECLAKNQQTLDLLNAAAKIKHCRYPADLEIGLNCLLPHLAPLKKAMQLLAIQAYIHAEKAQPDKAIDIIETMEAISHSISKEPAIISQLVHIACNAITITAAERVISRCELSDIQLDRIADIIEKIQTHSSMSVGYVGERCHMMSMLENGDLIKYAEGEIWITAAFIAMQVTGMAHNDLVINADLMTEVLNAADQPLDKQLKIAESIRTKSDSLGPIHLVSHMTMTSISRIVELGIMHKVQLSVAQTGIAVQRWKIKHGKNPENLNQLVGEYLENLPTDPYDGKPLRYKVSNEGFMVYSIGENKIDDGGTRKSGGNPGDIVFEINQNFK